MHLIQATSAHEINTPAFSIGGQDSTRPYIGIHPPNISSISDQAMRSLLLELDDYGLSPSTSTTRGLASVAEALEAMSEGSLPPQFHLSSLDPGVGKTTLIKHFIKALLASRHHEDVSVLVCFSRLEEIDRMFVDLEAYKMEIAIWTGNEDMNAKSNIAPNEARVLLTTQQKLEAAFKHYPRFADVTGLHYLDRPRDVRIWDESLLPGSEVLLSADDLSGLWGHFRRSVPKLCSSLEHLHAQLKEAATGDILRVPELDEMGGSAVRAEVDRLLASDQTSPLDKKRMDRLLQTTGQTLPVHRSNYGEVKLLDYRETLPKDLAPMVVLDASGRCRETYSLMEDHRDNVVRLHPAVKDYSNLQISLWAKGSGKSAHADDKNEVLVRGIAEKIMKRTHEDWLIVHHKDDLPGFRKRIEAHLGGGVTGQLHFLSWGKHHGTNAYAHVSNVILASLLHLPEEVYETRVRLCAGMESTQVITDAKRKEMALGEHLHNVLQALCRASVRGLQADGTCPPCKAYIIAPKAVGMHSALSTLFPRCRLHEWRPRGATKLSGAIQKALAVIDQGDSECFGDEITYGDLAAATGMEKRDFRKRVAKDPRFKEEISRRDYFEGDITVETAKGHRKAKGLVRHLVFPDDPSSSFRITDLD